VLKKAIFFLLSSLMVFGATVYYRLGAYKDVSLSEESLTEHHFFYKEHQGAYHKINDVIVEAERVASSLALPCTKTFGEYLDDPRTVDERHLRSNGGCVISAPLKEVPAGFLQKTIMGGRYLVAKFNGAPSIGPMKVYPKVHEWFAAKKLQPPAEVIEIYTIQGDREALTEYLFRISPTP
jgi:DNA gyrase inhibitor GyrI